MSDVLTADELYKALRMLPPRPELPFTCMRDKQLYGLDGEPTYSMEVFVKWTADASRATLICPFCEVGTFFKSFNGEYVSHYAGEGEASHVLSWKRN